MRVLMEVSGQNATAYTMVPQVILMIKAQHPNIPDEYWQQLLEKMKEKFIDRMVELIAPIYQKYLTLSDLKQIVAFYQTPVGKKLGEAVPSISMDSMQLGQKIGVEIVQEIQQDVKSYEQYL